MTKKNDLLGVRNGRLTVVGDVGSDKKGNALWLCICDCGNEINLVGHRIKPHRTLSCGCIHKEVRGNLSRTHGLYGTRLHLIWRKMKERCNNKNCKSFGNYGGRGITYCDEWENLSGFVKWANSSGYQNNLTIDRIDVNGNYEPSNCKWSTRKEQANNRRSSVFITINNETLTAAQWSEKTGINQSTILYRLRNGYTGESILKQVKK